MKIATFRKMNNFYEEKNWIERISQKKIERRKIGKNEVIRNPSFIADAIDTEER